MEAVLEKVLRSSMQGEETEIVRDVACDVDTDARKIRIRAPRDLDIQIGDELESDAFEWKRSVKAVRKERTEDGFLITLNYA